MVVYESGDATVWVIFGVTLVLLFLLRKVQELGLVSQAKLFQNNSDLPSKPRSQVILWKLYVVIMEHSPAVGTALGGEQSELLVVGHCVEKMFSVSLSAELVVLLGSRGCGICEDLRMNTDRPTGHIIYILDVRKAPYQASTKLTESVSLMVAIHITVLLIAFCVESCNASVGQGSLAFAQSCISADAYKAMSEMNATSCEWCTSMEWPFPRWLVPSS